MTYADRNRDNERRRQDEKRRADEQRRKAAQQNEIENRRRAAAAKQAQAKKQTPKPLKAKSASPASQALSLIPQTSTVPQRLQKTDLSAMKAKAFQEQAEVDQQRQDKVEQAQPPLESQKQKGFFDKIGGAIDEAKKRGGQVIDAGKNFGAGFFGQSMDNQATTPIQDAINPQAGHARQDWLERESQRSDAFDAGRKAADVVNIVQGAGQIGVGGVSMGGGTVVSGTGVGASVGAPAVAGGAIIAGHGAGTAQRAMSHLMHGSRGRLSNSKKARSNHEETGAKLNEGDQVHHHNTDKNVREHELNQTAREKIGYDLDRASNLEAFPSQDKVYPEGSKILHRGAHPEWDNHAKEVLDSAQRKVKKKYGSLDKVPDNVLESTMKDVENKLKKDLQNVPKGVDGGWLKPTPNGNFKISENTNGQEEPV
jgi:hypothetical protein